MVGRTLDPFSQINPVREKDAHARWNDLGTGTAARQRRHDREHVFRWGWKKSGEQPTPRHPLLEREDGVGRTQDTPLTEEERHAESFMKLSTRARVGLAADEINDFARHTATSEISSVLLPDRFLEHSDVLRLICRFLQLNGHFAVSVSVLSRIDGMRVREFPHSRRNVFHRRVVAF